MTSITLAYSYFKSGKLAYSSPDHEGDNCEIATHYCTSAKIPETQKWAGTTAGTRIERAEKGRTGSDAGKVEEEG